MKLSTFSKKAIIESLNSDGLALKIGLFNVKLSSPITAVAEHLICLYGAFDTLHAEDFIDFNVAIEAPLSIRRYLRPQVNFSLDGFIPFKPLPYAQAAAFFEWGLNWCISGNSNQFLIIHAAVVELNKQAFIFPGAPGSGKSTLSAAMVCRGWRLLSDELTLLCVADGLIYPVPRPISLKNQSLDIISQFSPDAVIGSIVHDTLKGSVGHMRPPDNSVDFSAIPAQPAKVIFPKFKLGANTGLIPLSKGKTLLKLAENCLNYSVLGLDGFNALGQLCDASDCYDFSYSDLDEAVALFTELAV
ncbi:MAG: HprK-related kinase A [Methylovulum sp.]|uniref:HprK-related kinase A n=1 Tax=Methylovulum sp. TaxID=1916980 RepID=UPI002625146D|nr:HprK-related kinase A [Methylovulum sp.]MDD2724779.1 HprK-related kinase A [Methylovulum sp.]MDD5126003.1 HprK-related kinase A [Methylovulum sp.]